MKKITQYLYIGLFLLMIGAGFILNTGNLFEATKVAVDDYNYDAWSIVIENEFNDGFWNRYGFIEVNGLAHKLLGQNQMNGMVKLNNGKLVSPVEPYEVAYNAQAVIELNEWLVSEDIEFVYMQTPYEICAYDSQLPAGVEDYSNYNADVFLQLVTDNNVPVVDLRESMHEAGMSHYESFYKTDHHWTVETSFWAFTEVVNYISVAMDAEVDETLLDLENYNMSTLYDAVLGSNGRKTGILYSGLDDITVITPKFNTEVSFSAPEANVYREGDFEDAFMVYERLEGDNLYEMLQYNVYIGQDYPYTVQTCENASNDAKILLIKDSFSRPVSAFLGTVYKEVHTIDMRYFEGDVQEYIMDNNIDMVIMIYNPHMLTDDNAFDF